MKLIYSLGVAFSLISALALTGCGSSADNARGPKATTGTGGDAIGDSEVSEAGHTHEGWWCAEHGVPEEVCAQCNSKVAAKLKAKGDWCQEHGVPESQCFICNPEFEKKFAAQYEAKYGKQPPKRETDDGNDRGHGA